MFPKRKNSNMKTMLTANLGCQALPVASKAFSTLAGRDLKTNKTSTTGFPEFPDIATRRDAPLPLRATSGAASVLRQRASLIDERVAAIDARLSEINRRLAALEKQPSVFNE